MTLTRFGGWRVAALLAVLVPVFCLSAALPAAAHEHPCAGPDSSERVCAQSGTTAPVLAVAHEVPPILTVAFPATPLSADRVSSGPVQHHADRSTPRAPPSIA